MKKLLALLFALVPSLALAQGAILQNGAVTPGDLGVFARDRAMESASKYATDTQGGIKPFTILDSLGDALCANSAVTSGTYHSLCIGHNASGDPTFKVDGTSYPFLGLGNGNVVGPNPSVSGNVAAFNNVSGTLLKDSGVSLRPNSVANGFSLAQQAMFLNGTYTGSGLGPYAEISLADTAQNLTAGTALAGLRVDHSINTTAGAGNRTAIQGILIQNAPTVGTDNNLKFYTGVFGQVYVNSNDNGVFGTPRGSYYGIAGIAQAQSGATFLNGVLNEIDVSVQAGASTAEKIILQLATVNSDAVKGSAIDAGLLFVADASTTTKLDKGIAFGKIGSKWPVSSTGTLVGVYSTTDALTAADGVDWTGVTFTDAAFKSAGFFVSPTGVVNTTGFQAGFAFQDRSGSPTWQWYGTAAIARLSNGAQDVMTIDSAGGSLTVIGGLLTHNISTAMIAAPASPPAGQFYIYMNSADNKLYAKGPGGTVTTLALP